MQLAVIGRYIILILFIALEVIQGSAQVFKFK